MKRLIMGLAFCGLLVGGVNTLAAETVDMDKRAAELKNLEWGMFLCWSFSTFSGKEWTPGVKDILFFKATEVDTDQWAKTAKEAGMGYILFLTKHHDGFCLWDTHTTDRKVTKAPLGKDVLKLLRESCDKYGIKLALYFSAGEFNDNKDYHPGGYTPEMKKAQLKELLTLYGPIEYIWFDHAQGDGNLDNNQTTAWCRQFQPGCLVAYNHGAPGNVRIGEWIRGPSPLDGKGYLLAEFTYPILPPHEEGAEWFYSLPKHDKLCLPAEKIYRDYLGAVRYENIFEVDVGPDYKGKLREIDVQTLRQVGEMIRKRKSSNVPMYMSLSERKPVTASSTYGGHWDCSKAVDGDDWSRWSAASDARSGWLEIDLGKDTEIGCAVVKETSYPRVESFTIEYKEGEQWKQLVKGEKIAGEKMFKFKPVKARYFRLNIDKACEAAPTIEEFQLFR